MKTLKSRMMMHVSAVALLAMPQFALAQSTDEDEMTTQLQGGQVVVEQEDPTVNVTVPDPNIEVSQGQPVVTVEQPQPEITVVVPEPTVRVQQQAPIITVEQAQPQITVRIPEPIVTVMVPNPQVDVETGEPMVDLEQPDPIVRFVRPEPRITIEESEPRIELSQGEADVTVSEAVDPDVSIEQGEAEVNIAQGDDANIEVTTEEPEVNVASAEEADVSVTQEEARVVLEDFNADEQGNMNDEDRERYADSVETLPIFQRTADELVGRSVATEAGEDVGEIDFIGRRGDTLVAILGIGGFLGMGENNVAVPVEKLVLRDDLVIVPEMTQQQLENMPEYNEQEVSQLDPDTQLSDQVRMR